MPEKIKSILTMWPPEWVFKILFVFLTAVVGAFYAIISTNQGNIALLKEQDSIFREKIAAINTALVPQESLARQGDIVTLRNELTALRIEVAKLQAQLSELKK